MKYAIFFALIALVTAPALAAGTYYYVDEDWEAAGAWTPAAPPAGWWTTYSGAPDDNDWHGGAGLGGSAYAAFVNDFPHESTPENDWLNTDGMDLSGITLVPSEGDNMYVEYDLALDWYAGSYPGTYFDAYLYVGGVGSISLNYIAHEPGGANYEGTYNHDVSAYAGYTYVGITFHQYMNDSWAINSLQVDNVKLVFENFDPANIKSASLGEIKALYRSH